MSLLRLSLLVCLLIAVSAVQAKKESVRIGVTVLSFLILILASPRDL